MGKEIARIKELLLRKIEQGIIEELAGGDEVGSVKIEVVVENLWRHGAAVVKALERIKRDIEGLLPQVSKDDVGFYSVKVESETELKRLAEGEGESWVAEAARISPEEVLERVIP